MEVGDGVVAAGAGAGAGSSASRRDQAHQSISAVGAKIKSKRMEPCSPNMCRTSLPPPRRTARKSAVGRTDQASATFAAARLCRLVKRRISAGIP